MLAASASASRWRARPAAGAAVAVAVALDGAEVVRGARVAGHRNAPSRTTSTTPSDLTASSRGDAAALRARGTALERGRTDHRATRRGVVSAPVPWSRAASSATDVIAPDVGPSWTTGPPTTSRTRPTTPWAASRPYSAPEALASALHRGRERRVATPPSSEQPHERRRLRVQHPRRRQLRDRRRWTPAVCCRGVG
jgi:hypothetical protein